MCLQFISVHKRSILAKVKDTSQTVPLSYWDAINLIYNKLYLMSCTLHIRTGISCHPEQEPRKRFYDSLKHATNTNKCKNSTIPNSLSCNKLWVHHDGSNGITNTWSAGRVTSHILQELGNDSDALVKVFILAVLISCFAQEWKPGLTWKFLYGSGLTHRTQNRIRRIFCFSCSWLPLFQKHPVWESYWNKTFDW